MSHEGIRFVVMSHKGGDLRLGKLEDVGWNLCRDMGQF